jgi:hypothetical protein
MLDMFGAVRLITIGALLVLGEHPCLARTK